MFPTARVDAVAPVYVIVKVTGPVEVVATEGALMLIVGGSLSTPKVADALDAGARFPAASDAVPAAMVIPSEPVPVIELMVTVAPEAVTLDTPMVPVAVPVVLKEIFAGISVEALAPPYVTANVTGPVEVFATEGAPIVMVGGETSYTTLVLFTIMAAFPAASIPLKSRS
jgi:hypothetical protein